MHSGSSRSIALPEPPNAVPGSVKATIYINGKVSFYRFIVGWGSHIFEWEIFSNEAAVVLILVIARSLLLSSVLRRGNKMKAMVVLTKTGGWVLLQMSGVWHSRGPNERFM